MPWINNRCYANPLFGRALERARLADEGGVWSEKFPEREAFEPQDFELRSHATGTVTAAYENPQNEQEARLANVVYNETSSLRHNRSAKGPASLGSLQDARVAIAEIANRALQSGHIERVAPTELSASEAARLGAGNMEAILAHNESLKAAREALNGSDRTAGATQCRLRSRPNTRAPIRGSRISSHFGPFPDTLGGTRTVVIAP